MALSQKYWDNLCLTAVLEHPEEYVVWMVFAEFLSRHNNPAGRFTIAPQPRLPWKPDIPKDRRCEIPDFALVNFATPGEEPKFKIRLGVEAKRARDVMEGLCTPAQRNHQRPDSERRFSSGLLSGARPSQGGSEMQASIHR